MIKLTFFTSTGKTFLNTIEYLDANSKEWTTFIPKLHSVDIFVEDVMSRSDEHQSDDNASNASNEDADKTIIGYNYDSNDVKIIKYKDMTKGTTENES